MMTERQAIRELATIQADIIRRLGANFGPPEDFREAFKACVKIMEEMNAQIEGSGRKEPAT